MGGRHFRRNPVFWLDIRARLRERRLWMLALFMLAIPAAISILALCNGDMKPSGIAETGMILAGIAVFSHGALLVLLSALAAAQRISQERERRTLPALVNSPMTASQIANGKLLGAWLFVLWLSCATLPFLAIASAWGGLPLATLLLCWTLNTLAAFAAGSLALGLSGLFGRSLSAYLASGAVLFLWCAVVPIVGLVGSLGFKEMPPSLYFAAFFNHLPLAPQAYLFAGADSSIRDGFPAVQIATAVAAWLAIAAVGRFLAIRGLRREIL